MIVRALIILSTCFVVSCTSIHTGYIVIPEYETITNKKPTSVYNVVKIEF